MRMWVKEEGVGVATDTDITASAIKAVLCAANRLEIVIRSYSSANFKNELTRVRYCLLCQVHLCLVPVALSSSVVPLHCKTLCEL